MIYVFFFTLPPEWQVYTYPVALLFQEAAEDGKLGPRS